jgi:hypothetical protein
VTPLPNAHGEPLLVVDRLTKRYKNHVALDDVSFTITDGITGILGENGAGKSTTIKILLGLVEPTAGRATVLGMNASDSIAVRARVGYMPEHDCLPTQVRPTRRRRGRQPRRTWKPPQGELPTIRGAGAPRPMPATRSRAPSNERATWRANCRSAWAMCANALTCSVDAWASNRRSSSTAPDCLPTAPGTTSASALTGCGANVRYKCWPAQLSLPSLSAPC